MARITVPRAELAELLDLPADASDDELNAAMDQLIAESEAREDHTVAAAAEARLRDEDERLVAAAINAGKIGVGRCQFWLDALQRDRGNRVILASLAPGLPPAEDVVADRELEDAHERVMSRLGLPTGKPVSSPRAVAASQAPSGLRSTGPAPSGPSDMLGIPIPQVPRPVRISRGKPPEQWAAQERSDFFMHRLGGRFSQGVKPPPKPDAFYQPSPNDHSEFVDDGNGGHWRAKPDYRPNGD